MNYNIVHLLTNLLIYINYYFTIFYFELYITINCTANTEAKIPTPPKGGGLGVKWMLV